MTETEKLAAGDGMDSDEFGSVVNVSGSTVAVGAPEDDVNQLNDDIGSVYIFEPQSIPTEYIYLPIVRR